jgi:hypothetical protein
MKSKSIIVDAIAKLKRELHVLHLQFVDVVKIKERES